MYTGNMIDKNGIWVEVQFSIGFMHIIVILFNTINGNYEVLTSTGVLVVSREIGDRLMRDFDRFIEDRAGFQFEDD